MKSAPHTVVFEEETFLRYAGLSLPRHVAYPMPTWWHPVDAAGAAAVRGLGRGPRDLSLYLHLPFCEALCTYCACNKTILRREVSAGQTRVERYLAALTTELEWRSNDVGAGRIVRQLHWGGGTPTYLDLDQIERLHRRTTELFQVAPDAEVSIEVDPRVTSRAQLELLRELGFNRVSMGVQDFDARSRSMCGVCSPTRRSRRSCTTRARSASSP
jgi:oxygen-independent coproporphyrinogen-3 oxidase